jgi:hypothetical protein
LTNSDNGIKKQKKIKPNDDSFKTEYTHNEPSPPISKKNKDNSAEYETIPIKDGITDG